MTEQPAEEKTCDQEILVWSTPTYKEKKEASS